MRPFCIFLCLVLFGCNIFYLLSVIFYLFSLHAPLSTILVSSVSSSTSAIIATIISSFPAVSHIALSTHKIWIEVALGKHFTLTDPNLDTDLTIYSKRKHVCVIDIHTKCMKRYTALLDLFSTRDLSAA